MAKLPISLCMIVRNEEEMLEECLMAAMPLVRQIVIVDTGSTDRTVEIAESVGAEVHHFKWINDFAAARNYSLSFAREEWILVLDADETIEEYSIDNLEGLLQRKEISSLELTIHNLNDNGPVQSFNLIRLFRNNEQIFFSNMIHEGVAASLLAFNTRKKKITAESGILVNHYGYLQDRLAIKGERNLELIRNMLAGNPDDLYFLMKEYEELEKLGRRDECNTQIEYTYKLFSRKKAEELDKYPFAPMIAVNYTQLLLDDAKWQKVITTADIWLEVFNDEPWLLYMKSVALLNSDQLDGAEAGFKRCLDLDIKPGGYYIEPGISSWMSRHQLGEIAFKRRDMASAVECFNAVIEENIEHFPSWVRLFDSHVADRNAPEAMKVIMGILEKDESNLWALVKGAYLMDAMKMKEKAASWCIKALEVAPGFPEAENLLQKLKSS